MKSSSSVVHLAHQVGDEHNAAAQQAEQEQLFGGLVVQGDLGASWLTRCSISSGVKSTLAIKG